MSKRRPKLGATRQHPEGKLNANDEGELRFGIANDGTHIIINFATPVTWLGLGPVDARDLAKLLISHAEAVERGAH